ncbi:MAG TPA: HipA domain-containing protein [Spirochaetota bacterium]|nr:HipA domain-containing protein [Spirochaetota bacterium]HOD15015.1 HipA domain-containing protein [Spirochaetota bacterium]HPG49482.1 HipA domain-containing protein [Spirochaetota bacterium]HPN10535.1 HipA domain-containing protein [Spirochaetota bacterium]HQL82043.1 HipA domain-containing protein [Spirochaetota bacterium]
MTHCLGCLKQITTDSVYCNACIKNVFNNCKLNPAALDFDRNKYTSIKYDMSGHFSISGVQDKISLKIENKKLVPTERGGQYILKPIPETSVPRFQKDIPANEHITMQIAKQLFKIKTAENALIRFSDGELAYIVKRFDVVEGGKIPQEDFCQLLQISEESHGNNYKYDSSYQNAAEIIIRSCPAHKIEIEKFYFLVLFDYFFSNGDAHLKNFSLVQSIDKDYILSPAYDLLATSLHFPDESRMALDLFDDYETESFKKNGFYKRDDFLHFAEILKINTQQAVRYIERFYNLEDKCRIMIERSFLTPEAKIQYALLFTDRLKAMKD